MNYKKLFVITRQFQKRQTPDDIMQLMLEFVGDLDETRNDLRHKHAFCRVEDRITGRTYCHYCKHCEQILMYKTNSGLSCHVKANQHRKSTNKLTRKELKQQTRKKIMKNFHRYFQWSPFHKNLTRHMLKIVDVEFRNKKT